MHISELLLSVRAYHALEKAGIETVEQLAQFDWLKFAEQNSAGVKTIAHIAASAIHLAKGDMLRRAKEWDKTSWASDELKKEKEKMAKISAICFPNPKGSK